MSLQENEFENDVCKIMTIGLNESIAFICFNRGDEILTNEPLYQFCE